ncbi:MAG: AAA family ATPase [Rhizobiales bacterium]|nr:AAA family ATPase [Hyphomicrobiales bacterium]
MFFKRPTSGPTEVTTPGAPSTRPSGPTADRTRLDAADLRLTVDPATLGVLSSAELEPATGLIGQQRALKAIELAASIRQRDFHLFVMGPSATGKRTAVKEYLARKAASEPVPPSWVYVNNFDDPSAPRALSLPPGRCEMLANGMLAAIAELRTSLPALFESDDYQSRHRALTEAIRSRQEQAFEALTERARSQSIAVVQTPTGIAMAPLSDGKVMKPEDFQSLPDAERKAFEARVEQLQSELGEIIQQAPRVQKEMRARLQELNEEVASLAIHQALDDVVAAFSDLPDVLTYLEAARRDLVRNVGLFIIPGEEEDGALVAQSVDVSRDDRFRRYRVNVIVSRNPSDKGAPIVDDLNVGHGHLVGRVEFIARMGALITDFLLIRPGSLHRANGGYLLLDAAKLLTTPFAYESLKRALRRREIRIESPNEGQAPTSTQTLEPDPIPLDVKVVLVGDRQIYYALNDLDPDFPGLFKVQADFDDSIDRTDGSLREYARIIASIVRTHELRHVEAAGMARLIERSARMADDNRKLSLQVGRLADILREADYYAMRAGRELITEGDVVLAVSEQEHRADRIRERSEEMVRRDIVMIDTDGARIGQVNGLSVLSFGNISFGKPTRITASVRLGSGRVTDIEREALLGGPLHSKGVMILWGVLASRYAIDVPLSIAASLVFEQSYGGVDGDSASSTELYALISALAEVPLRQSIAVTGSVNQLGEVQAIGGANEKIEGFFDICRARGLTGAQGVMIPRANIQHLMLRQDIVAAANAGQFSIYAVSSIDEGIEILTGLPAGERGEDGRFPRDSVNYRVERKLRLFAKLRREFNLKDGPEEAMSTS